MITTIVETLKSWAKRIKSDIHALYIAMHDPRTPLHAKYFAIFIIGYALSPIDLIPDFIPVLGLLDDLILLPLGIVLLEKMIPPEVMAHARQQATRLIRSGLPASQQAAMIIVAIWALVLSSIIWWLTNRIFFSDNRIVATTPVSDISTDPDNQNDLHDNGGTLYRDTDRSRSRER